MIFLSRKDITQIDINAYILHKRFFFRKATYKEET